MAQFKIAKSNTFTRKVEVFCNDESQGELEVTFDKLTQDELMDYAENQGDKAMLARVVQSVGKIPVEGSDQVLEGQAAIDCVLSDASCVSACAAEYLMAMKGNAFRQNGSRKRR